MIIHYTPQYVSSSTQQIILYTDVPLGYTKQEYKNKFKVNDVIIYYTYMLRTLKIARHKILKITEEGYEVQNNYYPNDSTKNHTIAFDQADKHFITLEECTKTYPDIILKSKINGPQ